MKKIIISYNLKRFTISKRSTCPCLHFTHKIKDTLRKSNLAIVPFLSQI